MVQAELGRGLSTLILYFVLPCAIIANFEGLYLDYRYLFIFFLGMVGNILMDAVGYLIGRRGNKENLKFWMLCMTGYNIGCFALPFVSIFLGPAGFVACCLFDAGNALFCNGVNVTFMQLAVKEDIDLTPKTLILNLFSKPVFTTYFTLVILSLLRVQLPSRLFSVAGTIGKANAPMSMLMIGILLDISFDKEYTKSMLIMIVSRLAVAAVVSTIVMSCTFLPLEMRKGTALIAFAPISAATTAYLARFNCRPNQAAFLSSASILVSVACMIIVGVSL